MIAQKKDELKPIFQALGIHGDISNEEVMYFLETEMKAWLEEVRTKN